MHFPRFDLGYLTKTSQALGPSSFSIWKSNSIWSSTYILRHLGENKKASLNFKAKSIPDEVHTGG